MALPKYAPVTLLGHIACCEGSNTVYSLEGLMLKLRYFGHLMQRADSLEKPLDAGKEGRQKEKRVAEDEMVGWHHQLYGHEFEEAPGVDGQGGLACCSPWGHIVRHHLETEQQQQRSSQETET